MPEFHSHNIQPHPYPSDHTVPQFLLDEATHPLRASRLPGSRWLIDDATGRAYGLDEIRERVERIARAVKARWGVGPGDTVCLCSENHIDYPIVIWAMHRLGCTVSPANPSYTAGELEYQLKESRSKLLFTSASSLPVALAAMIQAQQFGPNEVIVFSPPAPAPTKSEGCFPAILPRDGNLPTIYDLVQQGWRLCKNYAEPHGPNIGNNVAFLGFSSGTTGLPKAVAITHRSVISVMMELAAHTRNNDITLPEKHRWIRPGDVGLAVLPFYHIYGLIGILHALLFNGCGVVVMPQFNPQTFLETIAKHRITHLPVVPPIVVFLVNHPSIKNYDLSSLHYVVSSAAPLSKELAHRLRALIPSAHVGQGYGLTEATTLISVFELSKDPVDGSVGTLAPDTVARIIKPDGQMADYGESGELWIKGPQVALGYANNKKATEQTFVTGGWLRTGDEAYMTKEGNLYIVDRLKELIKVSGFQVAPAELEGHLLNHPSVRDAAIIGILHERKGEVPLAFVVLKSAVAKRAASGAEAQVIKQELRKWVSDNKVRYKRLEGGIEFVDVIPKNASGKILRRILKERAKARDMGKDAKVQARL
ncbi:phenylacetyl-CoA ligase [Dacryopinax primogenitus]|uniref:Phenylacetyl-CoA ligase n=1 Tax=Dacryopinax primogenitus (strain DJM 731) TaxID=1858805 RepID=M5FVQ2_DACPD|nr:phenylacetyl-CoA ligase [Dacryopinax primogenitus]EJT97436.1 phenylacetyl-CoA ligase [Dacryopinax primogenitus]